jgi:cobalt-precorrin-5B (C1)-methyltransferase
MPKSLRHGYTTGACAAAAASGAALMLKEQRVVDAVELFLPAGFSATFALHGQRFDRTSSTCYVVKDAGDDPDVTNGAQVHAEVALAHEGEVVIRGGTGIGRVTKPGLAVPVGGAAINPVPRRMITEAIRSVFPSGALHVTISIPDGEERARRTLNERLGIVGGLSILGTTGIVRPISHKAWTDTLDAALDVALACGCRAVVLSTGRTSEMAAQGEMRLPDEAFIMMGDHVTYALEAVHKRGISQVVLAAQFAKLVKIAAGHPCTHAVDSRLELAEIAGWGREAGLDEGAAKTIELANTAREVFEAAPDGPLVAAVAARALARMEREAPGARAGIVLIDYRGRAAARFGNFPPSPALRAPSPAGSGN